MLNCDKVFVNGKIFTSNTDKPYIESFACKDGKVVWTGNSVDINTKEYEVIDLDGKCVLPGFVDSHMHPMLLASGIDQIVCLPPKINSIEDIVLAIRKTEKASTNNDWIMGWGYEESKLKEQRSPNRYDLDKGSVEHPVCIMRSCAHILCVNSKALELAGITKDTEDIEGGEIVKDENGEPTGVLREKARDFVIKLFPTASEETSISPATSWADGTNPMYTLKAAVTRKAYNGMDCGQKHKVDLETAVCMYTTEGAEIMGLNTVGRIQEGYHADFVVLDRDIFEVEEDNIDKVKVECTYIDGNLVYKR